MLELYLTAVEFDLMAMESYGKVLSRGMTWQSSALGRLLQTWVDQGEIDGPQILKYARCNFREA